MHADPAAQVLCRVSHVQLEEEENRPRGEMQRYYCLPAATQKNALAKMQMHTLRNALYTVPTELTDLNQIFRDQAVKS